MYKFDQEEKDAVWQVIESGWLFRYGDAPPSLRQVEQFEEQFAARVQVPHALAVTSGTAALICALAGLGIGPGDEVILPGYTFIATASAIVDARAVPIIAEIDETLTLDINDVRHKITPRTKAIIPVHMTGLSCDLDPLLALAREHDLYLIEDACQAVGGEYKGQPLGSLGDASAFSLNYFKIIGVGEGGVAVTQDDVVFQRMRMYHDDGVCFRGINEQFNVPYIPGVNYRMNEMVGAFARVQLGRLDGFLAGMRDIKQVVYEAVSGALRPAPRHDAEGDCSTTLHFQFDSAEDAGRFEALLGENAVDASRPINSGRHVYSNWEFVMRKTNICTPGCSWACPRYGGDVNYAPDMCPNTLDILARTVAINTDPFWTGEQIEILIERLLDTASEL